MKVAAENNAIQYSDEKSGVITYKTGMSMSSVGFLMTVSLTKVDDGQTRIKMNAQKTGKQIVAWGGGGRTIDKFFNELDKYLEENTKK